MVATVRHSLPAEVLIVHCIHCGILYVCVILINNHSENMAKYNVYYMAPNINISDLLDA